MPRRPLILDQEVSNSTARIEVAPASGVYPVRSGGKLDPLYGKALRLRDLRKIETLATGMRRPIFLTPTLDREAWTRDKIRVRYRAMPKGERRKVGFSSKDIDALPVEELSYRMAGLRVARLLKLLGLRIWARVIEPQKESGDGWIHWHIVAETAGTEWCGGWWVRLKELNAAITQVWCREWGFARTEGYKGFDLQLAKSTEKVAGYMAGYLVKSWPAIPPWMLESTKGVRLVGFSKGANRIIRAAMGIANEPVSGVPYDVHRKKRRRPRSKLIDRLCISGMSCKAIRDGRYIGTFPVPLDDLMLAAAAGVPGLEIKEREYTNWSGIVKRAVVVVTKPMGDVRYGVLADVLTFLDKFGMVERVKEVIKERRQAYLDGWWQMQSYAESY